MRRLLALALAAVALLGCDRGTSAPPGEGVVAEIVDGDTIEVDIAGRHERVRLIGIDTPETVHPDRPVECYGPEASALIATLVPPGTRVRLERDVEPRDAYGRLLAYVVRVHDGLDVAVALAAAGAARPLVVPPNTAHVEDVAAAARSARAQGLGQWGACRG